MLLSFIARRPVPKLHASESKGAPEIFRRDILPVSILLSFTIQRIEVRAGGLKTFFFVVRLRFVESFGFRLGAGVVDPVTNDLVCAFFSNVPDAHLFDRGREFFRPGELFPPFVPDGHGAIGIVERPFVCHAARLDMAHHVAARPRLLIREPLRNHLVGFGLICIADVHWVVPALEDGMRRKPFLRILPSTIAPIEFVPVD